MGKVTDNTGRFLATLRESFQHGLTAGAAMAADYAVRSFGSDHGGVPSLPGRPPNTQSGRLRNTVTFTGADLAGPLTSAYGTNMMYGRVLELGGTIRARGKALAIPLSPEVKRQVARGVRPRSIINAYKFDRSHPLRWIKTKRGVLVVRQMGRQTGSRSAGIAARFAGHLGKVTSEEPLFLLVPQVRIAPRPWLARAYFGHRQQIEERIIATTRARMRTAYQGVPRGK